MTDDGARSTHELDAEAVLVGTRVRRLRLEQGRTMAELAALADLSQPFLSLVERGHARLSLTSMGRVARALGTRPGALMSQDPVERDVPASGVEIVRTAGRDAHGTRAVWRLAEVPGGMAGTEMVGTDTEGEPSVHDEDEFVYVLGGVLEVELDDGTARRLGPGESVAFAAGTTHTWRAVDADGYRVLIVVAPS